MITKHRTLFLVGILITLIPLLGFPSVYETALVAFLGLLVAFIAFLLAREKRLGLMPAQPVSQTRIRRTRVDRIHADRVPTVRTTDVSQQQTPEYVAEPEAVVEVSETSDVSEKQS